ncbi:MAG: hypothetical protein ABSH09_20110 [Bryobacteraceae bacterium]
MDKMHRLSQLAWYEVRQQSRHKLGCETLARKSLHGIPPNVTDDVDFIAFRFYKLAPMIGYRGDDGTFYIIWFDREFKLYNHG